MPTAYLDAVVLLKEDVLSAGLRRGAQGIVISIWLAPGGFFYEVEFGQGKGSGVRALLRAEQLEIMA